MRLQQYEEAHLSRLRQFLPECTVLLKANGDFPLKQSGKLALYGSGARNTVKGGSGSGEVNSRYFVTIEQGLRNAGFRVTTQDWLDAYDAVRADAKKQFIQKIKARAKKKHTNPIMEGMGAVMPEPEYMLPLNGEGDAAVYVLSRISGEGNDRAVVPGDILLTETEIRDILELQKKYNKFLLVINTGGPVDLSPVTDVKNILLLSQLGVDTGTVLADLLSGKAYPSGKLTTTWASWNQYSGIGEFGLPEDTRYKEGIYVGYRYFDSVGERALFPFGYGLSYTHFEITPLGMEVHGEEISVTVNVKNTGEHRGMEVVQLYVSIPAGKLDQPWQSLAAFEKTGELASGEQQDLTLSFALSELASFDEESCVYLLEQGDYLLRVGCSSIDTEICGIVKLDADTIVRKVRPVGGKPDFTDWKPETVRAAEHLPEVPVLQISADMIRTQNVNDDTSISIDPLIGTLSDEELSYLNVGAFDPKAGMLSIIGNAGKLVAGAAGETTSALLQKEIAPLVMADGPAGLRLSQSYTKDEKGVHPIGETMPQTILDFMPAPLVFLTSLMNPKPKKDAVIYHQYTTAIPIGTAIAQSWNRKLAFTCGDIVGEEMEQFGVHLWLAPALNIQRDIRCGRNFEYYSEDPLISGVFAEQITLGVQSHPGRGVTIKHYAANNQETNRYANNSMVSQRALREIYLRGFDICIRTAQPLAVMTSYNLLNGEHTAERRDLIEDHLRAECGFRGIVMTDWLVASAMSSRESRHAPAKASRIAAASGDLVMPGGKSDYKDILSALQNGTLSREQLQINGTRILRTIRILNVKSD